MFLLLGREQRGQGIHLPTPPKTPAEAVLPAGLAAQSAKYESLSRDLQESREAHEELSVKTVRLQAQRAAAIKQGARKLAQDLSGELQDILHRIAVIGQHIRRLERKQELLGWQIDAERRREDEKVEQVG